MCDPPHEPAVLGALDGALEGGLEVVLPWPEPVRRISPGANSNVQHCTRLTKQRTDDRSTIPIHPRGPRNREASCGTGGGAFNGEATDRKVG